MIMNREMKFRVWSKTINKMWYPKFALFESGCVYSKKEDYELLDDAMNGSATLDEDEIIMQYVGLKDKNGKEVYEGDIVKLDEDVKRTFNLKDGFVKYHSGGFMIGGNNGTILSYLTVLVDIKYRLRGEVIGNIYENPELLEVE